MVVVVNGAFLLLDLIFFAANATKLFEGGWLPVLIAGVVALFMLTWHNGARLVEAKRVDHRENESSFLARLAAEAPPQTPGVGAFLSAGADGIPITLSNHLRHNRALQRHVLLISVVACETPFVASCDN